ncbi:MAG TPA: chemotaxis protein CheB [Pseudomonadales bacterium]|nr:chemotaxis protein CheB [Pseudomonadales bacterium]
MDALRIGVIVDDPAQVSAVRAVISAAGQEVGVALEFPRASGRVADADVDAWVVNLDIEALEAIHPELLDELLDNIDLPLILCEGHIPTHVSPEFANWQRRLQEKLQALSGSINRNQRGSPRLPRSVWVLAGSIGGPEAVKLFLDGVSPDQGVAFIYANHIERDFQTILTQVMGKNGRYEAFAPKHGDLLRENSIAVISPDNQTSVTRDGSFNVRNTAWIGQYKPNLDQVVASTAVHFGRNGGVIVFSGMCDDAAAASRLMRRCGGQVWTQSRDSCVSWAMPDATEKAVGKADFSGSPTELAARLSIWIANKNQAEAKRAG